MRLSTIPRSQQGSGLILVIFILVVVAFVASIANKNQQKNSQQLISSVVGTRAEMAARTALQIDISDFYTTINTSSCRQSGGKVNYQFNGIGLEQCQAEVLCRSVGVLDGSGYVVYQLTSSGNCRGGDSFYQRIIEAGIRDDG